MGEIADAMIDGTLDQHTGEYIDGDSPGYPRSHPENRHYSKSKTLTKGSFMPMGKYRGTQMKDVPEEYLWRLYQTDNCCKNVSRYIDNHLIKNDMGVHNG